MKITAMAVLAIFVTAVGAGLMTKNWERIEKENNAFAKECNEKGKVAQFDFQAKQCVFPNQNKQKE